MRYGIPARPRAYAAALAVSGASLLALAGGASAETYKASTTEQFVEAVGKANANPGANTIVLASGGYLPHASVTFTNTSGLQTVEGPASFPPAKLEGADVEPVGAELLVVKAGVSVTFKNVVEATGGSGGVPAIDVAGTIDIESSTVGGNNGPAMHVEPGATATVRNSTISDGQDFGVLDNGTASFFNSTIAFNKNGGIENRGTLNLTNTIVAKNTGSGDCAGAANTSDHSLDSDGSCGVGALSKTNPLLGKLANNGGATPTHALQAGSPAVDAGDKAACPATDQEGNPRSDSPGTACDIGADELAISPFGNAGKLRAPQDVAVDSKGNLWVSDTEDNRVMEFSESGEFVRQVGSPGSGAGQLSSPRGLAVDSKGNVWVVDAGNYRVQEFNEAGEFVRQFGSFGLGTGKFVGPAGIAVDAKGHVWVSDAAFFWGSSRVQEFSEEGVFIRQFGTQGSAAGQLFMPEGLAVDSKGNVWVADTWNHRVQEFSEEGVFISQFGSKGSGNGQFVYPEGVTVDLKGNVWVADTSNNRVQELNEKGEYVTQFGTSGSGNGQLAGPRSVAVAPKGNVWVSDTSNNRLQGWIP